MWVGEANYKLGIILFKFYTTYFPRLRIIKIVSGFLENYDFYRHIIHIHLI